MDKYPSNSTFPRYSINELLAISVLTFVFFGASPTSASASDKAFSANATFKVDERCFAPADGIQEIEEAFSDVVEHMVDQGYGVSSGFFELYDPETSNTYIPFAEDGTDYLISVFDDGKTNRRFGGRDILLLEWCSPSRKDYFALGSYNAARIETQDQNAIPIDSTLLQASLGDPFNFKNLQTNNHPSDPFNAVTYVAVTGDQVSWNDLQAAFVAAGLTDETINLEVIPQEHFNFSGDDLTVPRDILTYLMRYQLKKGTLHPDAKPFSKAQLFNRSFPFRVFTMAAAEPRISLLQELLDPTPRFSQILIKRAIQDPFRKLVRNIKRHFLKLGYQFVSKTPFVPEGATVEGVPVHIFDHGQFCIENEKDCMFDKRDSLYWWDQQFHRLEEDDYYLLVGVNHPKLGMAKFSSRSIVAVENPDNGNAFEVIDSLTNKDVQRYPMSNVLNLNSLVLKLTAHKSFMVQVGRPQNCLDGVASFCPDTDVLGNTQPFVLTGELTLNPRTGTRPDENQVTSWQLLHFKVPPTP